MHKDLLLSEEELEALLGSVEKKPPSQESSLTKNEDSNVSGFQPPLDSVPDGVDLFVLLKTVDDLHGTIREMAEKIEGLETQLREKRDQIMLSEEEHGVQAEAAVSLQEDEEEKLPIITMSRKERHKKEKKSWF